MLDQWLVAHVLHRDFDEKLFSSEELFCKICIEVLEHIREPLMKVNESKDLKHVFEHEPHRLFSTKKLRKIVQRSILLPAYDRRLREKYAQDQLDILTLGTKRRKAASDTVLRKHKLRPDVGDAQMQIGMKRAHGIVTDNVASTRRNILESNLGPNAGIRYADEYLEEGSGEGIPILYLACRYSSISVCSLLIQHGACVSLSGARSQGRHSEHRPFTGAFSPQ